MTYLPFNNYHVLILKFYQVCLLFEFSIIGAPEYIITLNKGNRFSEYCWIQLCIVFFSLCTDHDKTQSVQKYMILNDLKYIEDACYKVSFLCLCVVRWCNTFKTC